MSRQGDDLEAVAQLAEVLASARSAVFFGGAGMSTESGIPDFRSADGLYATAHGAYPPEYMVSRPCLTQQPQDFWRFYREYLLHPDALPNPGHRALARLEQRGRLAAVVTQNIDGLHQAAGSRRVLELHGSVHRNRCQACGERYDLAFVLATEGVPHCRLCGAPVRPDVVLYEEGLDQAVLEAAVTAIAAADVLIIGGTSLSVYPAAGLVQYFAGNHLVLINRTETPYDGFAGLVIREPLGAVLAAAVPEG